MSNNEPTGLYQKPEYVWSWTIQKFCFKTGWYQNHRDNKTCLNMFHDCVKELLLATIKFKTNKINI
jgi:hypothetical protein